MKCANHYDRDAVSTCLDCGKALCPECTNKFGVPLCDNCSLNRISANKQLLIKNSAIMAVLFVIGFIVSGEEGFFGRLLTGYIFAGIPWGWSILNMITPSIFLFLPLIGWAIYFLVKLTIAMAIGVFATPYKIFKVIKGLNESKSMEAYTKNVV